MVIKEGISFMTCKLFVCLHKHCFTPTNDIIVPIHAGKALSAVDLGLIGDNTGDNISEKNPYFCELTATYWIWKNVKTDIVGLMHYRRFFNFKSNSTKFYKFAPNFLEKYGINEHNINRILNEYDIILPKKSPETKISVYDYYKKEHYGKDLDLVLQIIHEKYPSIYEQTCNILKNNSRTYIANMLICKKDLFDSYASWLFSILFELEQKIQKDITQRDLYQQRVYGFLAERLMDVFLLTNPKLKIKEFPILYHEDKFSNYLKYKIKMLKRRMLASIGLGKKKWRE